MIGLCSLMIGMVPGCGQDLLAPSPGPGSIPIAQPESAKTVFMITPGPPDADPEGWVYVAQREANRERLIFRSLGPGPKESPAAEPEVVRRAIADGASALIVVSSDVPGLPEALADAESKKIPVVVIGRPISAPPGSPPFTHVVPKPFDATAEQLVRTALGDAKKAGRPADGTAFLLVDRAGGAFSADRADALKAAATKAGLKVQVIDFDLPTESPTAATAAKSILDSPDVTILLAANDGAMQLATQVRKTLSPRLKVYVAGYASHRNASMPGVYGSESAYVEYRGEELGRLAVEAALGRLGGEEAGRKVEFDPRFRRGLALDSSPVTELQLRPSVGGQPKSSAEPTNSPR
jgi:ABC-type sugar transport system substrate-binding protein